MRGSDFIIGIPMGLIGFYGLSVASALWVGMQNAADYWFSMLVSVAVCSILGFLAVRAAPSAMVASGVMLTLVVFGFAMGSETYLWVPPFPADMIPVFFHGARSPIVIGPIFLLGIAGIVGMISESRQQIRVEEPSL